MQQRSTFLARNWSFFVALLALLASAKGSTISAQSVGRETLSTPGENISVTQERPTLTWIFTPASLYACESVAYELRRIVPQYHEQINITAQYITNDTSILTWGRSFLRRERLSRITLHTMTTQEYRQAYAQFAHLPVPMIILSVPGAPDEHFYAEIRLPEGARDMERLAQRLANLTSGSNR